MVRLLAPPLRALALAVLTTAAGGGVAGGGEAAPSSHSHSARLPAAPPPPALSSVVLPVSVPLASLQAAAEARVPLVLASLDQEYSALGGLLRAHLSGDVRRSGPLTLTPDGASVLAQLPVTAHLHVAPGGVGEVLTRDFSGSAVVTARLTPGVTPGWQTHVAVSADYRWTDPLSFDLVSGVRVNVQTLVDPQLRAQLTRLGDTLAASLAQNLDLKAQAGTLWARLGTPWTLPLPSLGVQAGSGKAETAYATITPKSISATPLHFTPSDARVVLGATFTASAGLLDGGLLGEGGQGVTPPVQAAPTPLPPLGALPDSVLGDPLGHASLQLPVLLPYAPLSRAASALAAQRDYPLPLPLSPRLHVRSVVLEPAAGGGQRVRATVHLSITALGLPLEAVVDVTGAPQLQGAVLTLPDAEVHTRPQGLSGRLIGWLADARVQRQVREQLRLDLAPALEDARAQLQARLPFTPAPGLTLAGQVRALRVTALQARADGLLLGAAAEGNLTVSLSPETAK